MKEKRKAKNRPRASRRRFVLGWTILPVIASLFISFLYSQFGFDSIGGWLTGLTSLLILPVMQFFWLRRIFKVSLRLWVPLTVLGTAVGGLIFAVLFRFSYDAPTGPTNSIGFGNDLFPTEFISSEYFLYLLVSSLLLQAMPAFFQWLTLRQRFQRSWLWLMAASAAIPLEAAFMTNNGSIFRSLARGLDSLLANPFTTYFDRISLWNITHYLDSMLLTALMGFALHYIITKSGDTAALRRGVETQEEADIDHSRLALKEDDETMPTEEDYRPGLAGAQQLTSAQ